MSDIVEIEAFRKKHIGKNVQYKVRALGTNEAWKTFEGLLTESGVTIREAGYDVYYDFPNGDFEYSAICAVGGDGVVSHLAPSPASSRAQSRAASLERAAINNAVARTSEQGAEERRMIAELISQMRESSAAERRQLLEEQRAAAAAAAAERSQMQALLIQVAEATTRLQTALAAATAQRPPTAPTAPAPTTATTAADDSTVGRRVEGDIFFPGRWQFLRPEDVMLKRLEVQQMFQISASSSPYRWRAFNALSSWMDAAFEQPVWSEAFANIGVTAMENLRAVVAQEDQKINARLLFSATATVPSDKVGEAISTLAKEAEKQRGRSRGRGGGSNNTNNRHGSNNNNNNNNNSGSNNRHQGNFKGPSQQ